MDTTLDIPFFSIILPVYNGEKFIAETIQSVLQQSFTAWELIIINDGSTDNTPTIVKDFGSFDPRIKLLNQSNKKQPAARNSGIKISSGQWIAFIDADDLWLPAKLELQYQCILKNDMFDVVFSDGYTKYEDKRIRLYYHYEIAKGFSSGADLYKRMLYGNFIPVLSAVVKSTWIAKIGMQDETAPGVEDHDYWLKLCRAGAGFYGMEERLFVYRIHDSNFSSNYTSQLYSSLIIRLKNYDAKLLNTEEAKRFRNTFEQYLQYFHKEGKTDWEQDLKARFETLHIPADAEISTARKIMGRPVHFLQRIQYKFQYKIQRFKKRFTFFLLKTLYFHPKKTFAYHERRIHNLYNKWLNSSNIASYAIIDICATAKLYFFNQKAINLDVQDIYIGDYSRINFMKENSKMIGGSQVIIGKYCNVNVVGQLILGNNVLFNNYSSITCHNEIIIGDDSWFGEGVKLYDHNHKYKDRNIPFTQQGYNNGKIEIGNNVWVGSNTVILQNVSIGDGCVIGANNVVYKSLPPNTILKSRSMDGVSTIT